MGFLNKLTNILPIGITGHAVKGVYKQGAKKAKVNEYLAAGNQGAMDSYQQMQNYAAAGPGEQDVRNYTGGQRDLAAMLQQYSQGGFQPGQEDITKANGLAEQMFQTQRTQQTQAFQDQLTQANRQAAMSGRGINDPILKAKLAQEQTRQGAMLNAQQGTYAAQYAQSMPGQRLDYAQQRVGVLGGLSQQAWQNQGNVFSMGSNIRGFQDQNRGGGFMGGVGAVLGVAGKVGQIAGSVAGAMAGNPAALGGLKGVGDPIKGAGGGGAPQGGGSSMYGNGFSPATYSDQQFGPAPNPFTNGYARGGYHPSMR